MKIDLNNYIEVTWTPFTEKDQLIRSLKTLLEQYKILEKSFEEMKDTEGVERIKKHEANIIYWLNNVTKIKNTKTISDLDNKEDLI